MKLTLYYNNDISIVNLCLQRAGNETFSIRRKQRRYIIKLIITYLTNPIQLFRVLYMLEKLPKKIQCSQWRLPAYHQGYWGMSYQLGSMHGT